MSSRKGASRTAAVEEGVRDFKLLARAGARAARSKMLSRQCRGDDVKGDSVRCKLLARKS